MWLNEPHSSSRLLEVPRVVGTDEEPIKRQQFKFTCNTHHSSKKEVGTVPYFASAYGSNWVPAETPTNDGNLALTCSLEPLTFVSIDRVQRVGLAPCGSCCLASVHTRQAVLCPLLPKADVDKHLFSLASRGLIVLEKAVHRHRL